MTKETILRKVADHKLFPGDRVDLPEDLRHGLSCPHISGASVNSVSYRHTNPVVILHCCYQGCRETLTIRCNEGCTDYKIV